MEREDLIPFKNKLVGIDFIKEDTERWATGFLTNISSSAVTLDHYGNMLAVDITMITSIKTLGGNNE